MIYLLASIVASVLVSILLKVAKKNKANIAQAVAINYPIATLLSLFLLKPNFGNFSIHQGWGYFVLLGILLPSVFIIMGKAIQKQGIVKADAAQRLSLIIGLIFSFIFWQEALGSQKMIGIGVAFIALIFLLLKNQKKSVKTNQTWLLILVWLGYGSVDILFKLISQTTGNTFAMTLTLSFVIAGILIFSHLFYKKTKFNLPSLFVGIILGILNFTNIFTYIKAHQVLNENPSIVFTGMNIGVIAFSTIVGSLIFREKISHWNFLGIALAILAIIILFLPL